jgi:hypothetical protein
MVAFTLRSVAFVLVGVFAASGAAQADAKKSPETVVVQKEKVTRHLAQNQVVVPAQPAPAPAPAAQPAPVQVAPQPVEVAPHKTVVTEPKPQNFMATVATSTFFGVLTGALVGAAVYFLDEPRRDPQHIYYWGAGGALVGLGIGLINVAANEEHHERAVSDLSGKRGGSNGPRAFGVRLLGARF